MQRLVYRSNATPGLESDAVFKIIETSARKNAGREVTGFLIFDGRAFLQLVEGPSHQLDNLLQDLAGDIRHHSIEVLDRSDAAERWFPDWRMKRLISFSREPALEELRSLLSRDADRRQVLAIVESFIEK